MFDMRRTCAYGSFMAKMIQLRNVPDELHRKLKARAARAGKSLSDYLLDQIRRDAERPTMEELMERLATLPPVKTRLSPAEIIRQERAKRDRRLGRR
jgi:plasmid stability protein